MTPLEKLDSIIIGLEFEPRFGAPIVAHSYIERLKKLRDMLTPRVRQLEWIIFDYEPDAAYAISSLGSYDCYLSHITKKYKISCSLLKWNIELNLGSYDSLENAQAACQAHFEKLVLSCLEEK